MNTSNVPILSKIVTFQPKKNQS